MMAKVLFKYKKIKKTFNIEEGKTILDLSKQESFDIEGSCGGSMACSTCHVLIHEDWISKLTEETVTSISAASPPKPKTPPLPGFKTLISTSSLFSPSFSRADFVASSTVLPVYF